MDLRQNSLSFTHRLHKSTSVPYRQPRLKSSGAAYSGEPHCVLRRSSPRQILLSPKSTRKVVSCCKQIKKHITLQSALLLFQLTLNDLTNTCSLQMQTYNMFILSRVYSLHFTITDRNECLLCLGLQSNQ